jgi:hypothetical protein
MVTESEQYLPLGCGLLILNESEGALVGGLENILS